mgnify:CR=1 FL=1
MIIFIDKRIIQLLHKTSQLIDCNTPSSNTASSHYLLPSTKVLCASFLSWQSISIRLQLRFHYFEKKEFSILRSTPFVTAFDMLGECFQTPEYSISSTFLPCLLHFWERTRNKQTNLKPSISTKYKSHWENIFFSEMFIADRHDILRTPRAAKLLAAGLGKFLKYRST